MKERNLPAETRTQNNYTMHQEDEIPLTLLDPNHGTTEEQQLIIGVSARQNSRRLPLLENVSKSTVPDNGIWESTTLVGHAHMFS